MDTCMQQYRYLSTFYFHYYKWQRCNRPTAHSRFNSKILKVISLTMVSGLARTMERTTNLIQHNVLLICRQLKLIKNVKIDLKQIEKIVTILIKILNRTREKMLFSFKFAQEKTLLPALKGNNSCIIHNFRMKVGNVQMVHCH